MANLQLTIELEDDGRFIAEIPEMPGVSAYGSTREMAIVNAEALALRVLADKLEAGEKLPALEGIFALPHGDSIEDSSEKETAYLLSNETMKARLLEAKNRDSGLSLEEVLARLGV